MNLQTVITNLKNTIAGKEMLLETYKNPGVDPYPKFVKEAMIQFLETNISELNRILDDLVECQVKGIELSWRDNPDRSGGQFTQDEIDNTNRW